MKHLNKLFFAMFLLPLFSIAQSNYKPGYAVTLKGDTIRGLIDFQEWDANPTVVSFKSAISDAKPQKFTIGDIRFFDVAGMVSYQKYTCAISMDETNISHLGTSRDTSFKIDTVFLKILQRGKNVSLYEYTDSFKSRFYIGEAPGFAPTELVFRLWENVDANGTTANENIYLKQLFALANKYNVLDDDLTRTLQSANYIQPDLLGIVSKINVISKAEYVKKYAGENYVNFYISAAVNISTTSSTPSSQYVQDGGGASFTSFGPAVSLGINVTPNQNTGKMELRAEIGFAESSYRSLYQLKVTPFAGMRSSFDQMSISFVPQLIYNFYNTDNFKVYGGIGFEITHFIFSNSYFGSANPGVSDNGVGANESFSFLKWGNSLMLKAGIKINKRFEVFAEYFTPATTVAGGYFLFSNSNEQIGITYLFGI